MSDQPRGPIAWLVNNKVTPNLLMLALILGGVFTSLTIKQEVFPEFDMDYVVVSAAYPGASPEEIERSVILALEEEVRGVTGVIEVQSTSREGVGSIVAELDPGQDRMRVYQDIVQAVDRVRTLPTDAERPETSLMARKRGVMSLEIYGDTEEATLREVLESVRDRLLQREEITSVEVKGVRGSEIHVEISEETLRAYGLTLEQVARIISTASVELPGGKIETQGGEILLRVRDRRDWARQFEGIPLLTTAAGTVVRLGDVAEVREGFEDAHHYGAYNGERAAGIEVYRVGEQTPIGVSDAVRAAMAEIELDLPEGIEWGIRNDRSEHYRQRLELLLRNALLGLVLVLVILGVFLDLKLAFWVTMGIPTSFLGGLILLGWMGVSINMISMFAFIIALGIVVDDAIIAGENIYEHRRSGMGFAAAAIVGAKDVAVPIGFSIITNMVTFLPLAFIPGVMGKIFKVIPAVVITVFAISWFEALFILPSHLAHSGGGAQARAEGPGDRLLGRFIDRVYRPLLALALRWRFVTVAIGFGLVILVGALVASRRVGFILMPRVESDVAVVTATLPEGSPLEALKATQARLEGALRGVAAEHGGDALLEGVFTLISSSSVEVSAYLRDPDTRPLSTSEVTRLWRRALGDLPGLESIRFEADRGGPGAGKAFELRLSHRDVGTLEAAAEALAEIMAEYPDTSDINDGHAQGKAQLDFQLTPEGESLGLTSTDIARQVRHAFYGVEAIRQQRGRDELKVRVRRPEAERRREEDVLSLMIRAPQGAWVPLRQVASVTRGHAYTSIERLNGRRTLTVGADVQPIKRVNQFKAAIEEEELPKLAERFPGLSWGYDGRQEDMQKGTAALMRGLLFALGAIYFLLAVPFRSYAQPLVVMVAIPFGVVGAVLGHLIMGYNLSLMSVMGIVALAGVVVNDSLVLIHYANQRVEEEGASPIEAVMEAGARRFRPVLLTTLTTFVGLAPMILETSRQARFLIPMALSLGFGILFATVITLLLVPSLYVVTAHATRRLERALASLARRPLKGPARGPQAMI